MSVTSSQAREILWRRGVLFWKLDSNQRELYSAYKKSPTKILVWNCCRGMGKSFLLCVIAIEECLNNPKALVKYACPTQTMAREIVQPLFRDILEDCPIDIKPEYKTNEHAYRFPNGAVIQLSGLDNGRAETLRGGSAVLGIVDEAGAVKSRSSTGNLKYIIRSIMLPAVTRSKSINGKIILASTPPENESHPFVFFMRRAELEGALSTKIIYQCPRYTKEMIDTLIENLGGINSSDFRREYLAELVTDQETAVIPEFTKELQSKVVKTWPKPLFYHSYISMDIGMKDLTVVLFAYYDFKSAKVIIEDEYVINGKKFTTQVLAEAIKQKEYELWANPQTGEYKAPFKRVSDNNLIVINDMYQLHGLLFEPTRKDDKEAALNNLKIMLAAEKIVINPKCETLIRHLRDATWAKNKKTYDRSVDNGHYDAVDAIAYLIRNIDFNINPYPAGYGLPSGDGYYRFRNNGNTPYTQSIKQILNIKK